MKVSVCYAMGNHGRVLRRGVVGPDCLIFSFSLHSMCTQCTNGSREALGGESTNLDDPWGTHEDMSKDAKSESYSLTDMEGEGEKGVDDSEGPVLGDCWLNTVDPESSRFLSAFILRCLES